MRVEILEERLSSEDSTGRHHLLGKGDVITVPDDTGAEWCARGWAKDAYGKVPTGERVAGAAVVQPNKTKHAGSSRVKGARNG